MIIKKFQAETETDAILAAKEEMGSEAVVVNIKTVKPKGLFSFFRKMHVEVTAVLEEKDAPKEKNKPSMATAKFGADSKVNQQSKEVDDDEKAIEEKLFKLQAILEKQMVRDKKDDMDKLMVGAKALDFVKEESVAEEKEAECETAEMKNMPCLKLIYNKLIENEVDDSFANQIIEEVEKSLNKEAPLDNVLAAVYQRIILKLGEPISINSESDKKKIIFLVGPTGVGKTTTIAKLASTLKLNKKAKLALITADTYRIAAVEQLRTYANILDVPLTVVYTESEMMEALDKLSDYDIILVDTAGRSHKDSDQCEEVFALYNAVDEEKTEFEKEAYLVVSATTKYRDLLRITKAYEPLGDYRIIFTKLDETFEYGNIVNIAMATGKSLSYTTFGQNVPDDIGLINVQSIAKQLLGGGE